MPKKVHNVKYLETRRRNLRNKSTRAEVVLWNLIKDEQLGRKFRRQHSIENYIVDFYCPKEKRIIELDGEVHNNLGIVLRDEYRSERLTQLKYRIVRFENNTMLNNSEGVIEAIKSHFKNED